MKKIFLLIGLCCLFQQVIFSQNDALKKYQLNNSEERKTPYESQLKYLISNTDEGTLHINYYGKTKELPVRKFIIDLHYNKLHFDLTTKLVIRKNIIKTEIIANGKIIPDEVEDVFTGKVLTFHKRKHQWEIDKMSSYDSIQKASIKTYLHELNEGKNNRLQDFIYPDQMLIGETFQIDKSSVNHFFDISKVTDANGTFTLQNVQIEEGETIATFDVDFHIKGYSKGKVELQFKGTIQRSLSNFYDKKIDLIGNVVLNSEGGKGFTEIPVKMVLTRKLY